MMTSSPRANRWVAERCVAAPLPEGWQAFADEESGTECHHRENAARGAGGHLNPWVSFIEARTAYSEGLPTLLKHLAERAAFSQVLPQPRDGPDAVGTPARRHVPRDRRRLARRLAVRLEPLSASLERFRTAEPMV